MKLVVMHYLRSLRERGELDAIFPDLLAESGFEILTRPRRGTRQAGVDVAAVGADPDRDGVRSLFLFTIKSGDLTREHWDAGQQAVRPSLNGILDDYIPNRIPPHSQICPSLYVSAWAARCARIFVPSGAVTVGQTRKPTFALPNGTGIAFRI